MGLMKHVSIWVVLGVSIFQTAWAESTTYEKGMALYNRGDWIGALSYFQTAAESGEVEAQRRLGYILWRGGSEQDQAERWLRAAATAGDEEANNFYRAFVVENKSTAIGRSAVVRDWLAERSEKDLGVKYILAGTYEGEDDAQALRLYEELEALGHTDAVQRLVYAYRYGELGVTVDEEKAKQLEGRLK